MTNEFHNQVEMSIDSLCDVEVEVILSIPVEDKVEQMVKTFKGVDEAISALEEVRALLVRSLTH